MNIRLLAVLCTGLALTLSGCGSGNPGVRGTVKFADGTPLTKGQVVLNNDQHSAYGEIKPDGTFTMGSTDVGDGVPPGTYKVSIGGEAVGGGYENEPPLVHKKFTDPTTSGLTVEVKEGGTELPIVVEKP